MRAVPRIPYPVYRSTTGETERDVFGLRRAPGRYGWRIQVRRRWGAPKAGQGDAGFTAEGGSQ
jgi:hypothetical protein